MSTTRKLTEILTREFAEENYETYFRALRIEECTNRIISNLICLNYYQADDANRKLINSVNVCFDGYAKLLDEKDDAKLAERCSETVSQLASILELTPESPDIRSKEKKIKEIKKALLQLENVAEARELGTAHYLKKKIAEKPFNVFQQILQTFDTLLQYDNFSPLTNPEYYRALAHAKSRINNMRPKEDFVESASHVANGASKYSVDELPEVQELSTEELNTFSIDNQKHDFCLSR